MGLQLGSNVANGMTCLRGGGEFQVAVNGTNGTACDAAPAMIILSSGNVGIGITGPLSLLHASGTGNTAAEVQTNTSGNASLLLHNNGSNLMRIAAVRGTQDLAFFNNSSAGRHLSWDSSEIQGTTGNIGVSVR